MRDKRLYNIFWHMIRRTENPKSKDFKYYGAKGITICPEWRNNFDAFQAWALKNGYANGLTIDRIDNSKGYTPDNCRWATKAAQNNHKTDTNTVMFDGKIVTYADLSRRFNIPCNVIRQRLNGYGWSIERAVSEPVNKIKKKISYNGKTQSVRQWALELDIPYSTLKQRINTCQDVQTALGV